MSTGPTADTRFPFPGITRTVFLRTVVTNPRIVVGDHTYYDDLDDPAGFERNVLCHFDFIGDRLVIGRFCQIAAGARFVMNGGNHRTAGFSSYPFFAFGQGWSGRFVSETDFPNCGDMVIGNNVWIDHDALRAIDLQTGFCHPDGSSARHGREIAPMRRAAEKSLELVGHPRAAGLPIIWTTLTLHPNTIMAAC